ncbi:hypothetical protein NQ317_012063 [Molorchus minor]|uniref:Uncharacterized protein n=1 Tax=Molorchus minor TaxID=1323400 RepID=A0ABQ9K867_9CUCU|nr:hypothetical protein NQ317_012063 [Molorchus minor]
MLTNQRGYHYKYRGCITNNNEVLAEKRVGIILVTKTDSLVHFLEMLRIVWSSATLLGLHPNFRGIM